VEPSRILNEVYLLLSYTFIAIEGRHLIVFE
jgi:hypothetical protein